MESASAFPFKGRNIWTATILFQYKLDDKNSQQEESEFAYAMKADFSEYTKYKL